MESMPEFRAIRRTVQFDLYDLLPGETVEIRTRTGSTYWITASSTLFGLSNTRIRGVSIQTNSKTEGNFPQSPDKTVIGRVVYTGERFLLEHDDSTSRVSEINPPPRRLR